MEWFLTVVKRLELVQQIEREHARRMTRKSWFVAVLFGSSLIAHRSEAQVTVPFTTLNFASGAGNCSSSKGTAYIAFRGTFTCTNHPAQTGCVAKNTLFLSTVNGSGLRPFQCDTPGTDPSLPITNAKIELSGLKIDQVQADGGVGGTTLPFADISVSATNSFSAFFNTVKWQTVINWKNTTSSMVDQFNVTVSGTIIWTTGVNSALLTNSGSCTASTSSCSDTDFVNVPAGWVYGGTAFSSLSLVWPAAPGTNGQPLLRMMAEIDDSSVTGSTVVLKNKCLLEPLSQVQCGFSTLSLVGKASEIGPESHAPSGVYTLPTNNGFAFPTTYPKNAMRCGLKRFLVEDSAGSTARNFGSFWTGADARDCNWSPSGPSYNGITWNSWFAGGAIKEGVTFEATRLK